MASIIGGSVVPQLSCALHLRVKRRSVAAGSGSPRATLAFPGTLALTLVLTLAAPALAASDNSSTVSTSAPDPKTLSDVEGTGFLAAETKRSSGAQKVLLVGGTVMTAEGEVLEGGSVAFDAPKITYVGATQPELGPEYRVVDATGKWITPGLIDTHSHLGVYPSPGARAHSDGNEATAPSTAGVWAEHSFWPQDPGIQRAVQGGVTAIQVLPGSANLIGGRGVVLEMVPQRGSRAMRFEGAPETLKMACGENPKRVYGGRKSAPSTRMGNLRGQRAVFMKAQALDRKWDEWEEAQESASATRSKRKKKLLAGKPEASPHPDRDLDLESLVGVLRGEILPQIHCYRADDMLSMVQLSQEFGFKIRSFHHALEAYKIADILAANDISASTWADWWGFKLEAYDGIPENAALLHAAGGRSVIHSDSAIDIQRLNQEAAKAMWSGRHAGLDIQPDDALAWITLNPAWTLGIDHLTGSLREGKRADLVVWDGDPLSVYSKAEEVYVRGRLLYRRGDGSLWSDFELGQGEVR